MRPTILAVTLLTGCLPDEGALDLGAPGDAAPVDAAVDLGADAAPDAGAALGGILVDIRSVAPCNCEHLANCVRGCEPTQIPGPLGEYDRRFWEVRFYLTAGGASAPLGLPPEADVTGVGPPLADACRDDRLFVHFPGGRFPTTPAFDLAAFEEAMGRAMRPWWFVDAEQPDPRPQRDRAWLRVEPGARCHVVAALRAAVEAQVPEAAAGRVCEFTPQLLPELYAGSAVDWHLRAIDGRVPAHGAWSDPPPALPALPAGPRVDVMLFDSGWTRDDEIALSLQGRGVDPFEEVPGGPPTRHGAQMGALVRQITGDDGQVRLRGWRVMDETGRGSTHDLAAALVDALHVQDRPNPAIINLSLGWPAGLSMPRTLWTQAADPASRYGCGSADPASPDAVMEDGAGEAVRHLLAQADALDIPVFAANGNRPGRAAFARATPTAEYGVTGAVTDDCLAKLPNPSPWFFPAEWGYTPATCAVQGNAVGQQQYAVVPIAGVDAAGQPGRATLEGGETPLVAPGEQVFVGTGGVDPVIGPRLISGSSAAAALTTGAAARAQVLRLDEAGVPLGARDLVRLLWVTGIPMVAPGVAPTPRIARGLLNEPPVRQISTCRAEATLHCALGECPDGGLVACLEREALAAMPNPFAVAVLDGAGGGALPGCRDCFEACLAASMVQCQPELPAPMLDGAALAQLDGCFADDGECPLPEGPALATDVVQDAAADAAPLPFELYEGERLPDAYELGHIGPQPWDPGCPTCPAEYRFDPADGGASATLHALLNPDVFGTDPGAPQATLLAASLVIQHPDGAMAWAPIYHPDGAPWIGGEYVKISGLDFSDSPTLQSPSAWAKAKGIFVATIRVEVGKYAGTKYIDESVVPLIPEDP